jgi:DNA modification methylase
VSIVVEDEWLTMHLGDCREVIATMPAESVHCVVTSPPYWGLRSYGTTSQVWGGDPEHDHEWGPAIGVRETTYGGKTRWQHVENGRGDFQESRQDREDWLRSDVEQGNYCDCGAWRGDLGLEPTPEQFVANIVSVFREVRRVLRPDGTVWLNLGDCYATGAGARGYGGKHSYVRDYARSQPNRMRLVGLKPKDLVGIPWRVAFALQADGWYLRSDIIWAKPNPMPESITDRPTRSHEYIFLLSKSARYYYDHISVKERASYDGTQKNTGHENKSYPGANGPRDILVSGRNLRSVWTIATQPYPGAHFATFPRKLVEPCIKAGTSERGVCPECGASWRRVVDRWQRSCAHSGEPVPATVLDPFGGSGTVAVVAQRLGRRAILIDLSADYCRQAIERIGRARGAGDGPALDITIEGPADSLWTAALP